MKPEHRLIGIIGAMDSELETLLAAMTEKKQETLYGLTFTTGTLDGCAVVLVKAGIGKVNAARCTQLLIDRRDEDLDEDAISEYITEHYEGNSLIVAGDEDLVKIHFHTNEPWKVLAYCNTIGEIYDIVIEDMIRQANGLQG